MKETESRGAHLDHTEFHLQTFMLIPENFVKLDQATQQAVIAALMKTDSDLLAEDLRYAIGNHTTQS